MKYLLNQDEHKIRKLIRNLLFERLTNISIQEERVKLFKIAVPEIEKILKKYKDCKIGKTSIGKDRFDLDYTKEGFIDMVKVVSSESKVSIDKLEKDLILYFKGRVGNIQIGGGNKSYSGEYWIYVVHKGDII